MTTAMTAILKQFQATPPLASVKAVEEICVTCGGAHPYYQCLAAGGNTFPEHRDNIQGYVSAATVNYNQGNSGYRPPSMANQILPAADFVIVDYESDLRVPLILGRPLLRTARALIDVHGEEMILHDGDERLTLNMRHDTSSYSNQPQKESINLIIVFNNSSEDFLKDLFSNQPSGNPTFSSHLELTSPEVNDDIFDSEGGNVLPKKLLDLDSTKDLHPPLHVNLLSGNTTYFSSYPLLEEFADELTLITFPPKYDDDLWFDVESDLKEIEFMLNQDIDSSLKDSIDQSNLANLADIFVDSMSEMFTDEHAFDYSPPLIFDEYDDDFLEVESDAENVYDDPFDSKGEKIKESKLLIDELDLPCDFLPSEYDSFISQDFSKVDALPSTNNKDKVFNSGILIQEKYFEIITLVVLDKKLAISNASLVLEDFDPPFYEPLFFKEVPRSKMLLLFSSENEETVFKPRIHTSEKVHSSRIPELSHQGHKIFKINQIFKSPMKIFLFFCGKDTHTLVVPCLHFYPLDQFKYGGISGIVLDGPSIPIPPPFINTEEDERLEKALTDQDLAEYSIKVPPPFVQKPKPHSQRNFVVHQRDPLHPNIPYP
uniref:Reverse transcriptase domain-containing protein n=1 Tax=Tanacetum cinerariifolium TaxID=118510 RepID=A0A699J7F5_TANCI|nr:reverse transcriptase domain-containing protein [Tanacetum cinerariifolium]